MKKLISLLLCVCLRLLPAAVHAAEKPVHKRSKYMCSTVRRTAACSLRKKDKRMKPAKHHQADDDAAYAGSGSAKEQGGHLYSRHDSGGQLNVPQIRRTGGLTDLAAGMMMCSGNDAANAAALGIGAKALKDSQLL